MAEHHRQLSLVAIPGAVLVYDSEAPEPRRFDSLDACRRLLAHDSLLAALKSVPSIASDARAYWDADQDSKVGKILSALAGHMKNYRADIDAIHAAITQTRPEGTQP